jgi:hypothetical protein
MPKNPCIYQPSPKACTFGSFFYDSSAPSEYLRVFSRPAPFDAGPLPHLGLVPTRDITGCRPLVRGFQCPATAPLSAFLRLSTVFSDSRFCGLIASRGHVQGFPPSKGFSLHVTIPTHRWDDAPLPFDLWSLTGKPVATSTGLDFEAFLHIKPRCLRSGVNHTETRSLHRVCVSSRLSPALPLPQLTRGDPLMTLTAEVSDYSVTSPVRLQRFTNKLVGLLISEPPTCPRLSDLPSSISHETELARFHLR